MVEYVSKKNNKRTSYYKIYNKTGGASVRISKAEFLKKSGGSSEAIEAIEAIDPTRQSSGPNDSVPDPALNGGLYTGEKFSGPWGNYPVPPTANGFMANLASADPPPGAMDSFPGYVRMGNNYQVNPTVDFNSNSLIKCNAGGSKKTNKKSNSVYNKKGAGLLEDFSDYLTGKKKDQHGSSDMSSMPAIDEKSVHAEAVAEIKKMDGVLAGGSKTKKQNKSKKTSSKISSKNMIKVNNGSYKMASYS